MQEKINWEKQYVKMNANTQAKIKQIKLVLLRIECFDAAEAVSDATGIVLIDWLIAQWLQVIDS